MRCIPLQPPILFGSHHHHDNLAYIEHAPFANLPSYHLTFHKDIFNTIAAAISDANTRAAMIQQLLMTIVHFSNHHLLKLLHLCP